MTFGVDELNERLPLEEPNSAEEAFSDGATDAEAEAVVSETENRSVSKTEEAPVKVKCRIFLTDTVNYALQQNRIPIVQKITLENEGDAHLEDLEVEISASPAFCYPCARHVDRLPSETTVRLGDVKLIPDGEYLASLTERQVCVLTVAVRMGERVLCTERAEITCLAFDEWHGFSYYPELLSSFVTPNHPQVARLAIAASSYLEKWTGDPSLDGYLTGDANRVLSMAAAVYSALCEEGIRYALPPAGFSSVGQRVRLCDAVLTQRLGTCLDLTLLYASVLEAIGLNPILLLREDHIFAGVWLEDRSFPEPVQDDASLITKRLADGVNEVAVVECTLAVAGKNASFDAARAAAQKELQGERPLEGFVDVKRARQSGILPLPSRVKTEVGWTVVEPAKTEADLESAPTELGETIVVEHTKTEAEYPKMVQWERKLLDLGMRNQLINFRLTKNTLPILISSLDELENALSDGKEYAIRNCPDDISVSEAVTLDSMPDSSAYMEILHAEFKNLRLRTPYSEAETARILKELYRGARVAIEENGANTLYLAMGLLRWYENPRSTKARYAPLILFPVEIIRRGAAQGYTIRLRDDEARINVTLLEKLKQEFEIEIDGLDPLPQDEHGVDIRRIVTVVRKAIMGQRSWDVLESAHLGIFSFSQFVMWNDIRNRAEDLQKNKIVRSLIDGRLSWEAEEMEIGARVDEDHVYLPIPADASQLYAIEAACRGESFVLHGPPGTGKSQTITSLIANALAEGKTVLFVAEKMAALEVVQKRLEKIGIGDFCLELHSNKSRKKDVLEQLRRASEVNRHASSEQYEEQAERLSAIRAGLDSYARALHRTLPCGMSLFDVIDRLEAVADADPIPLFDQKTVDAMTPSLLDRWRTLADRIVAAGQLVRDPKNHPFSPIKRTLYHQSLREEILAGADEYGAALDRLEKAASRLGAKLDWQISDLDSVNALSEVAGELKTWETLPRSWAETENITRFYSELQTLARDRIELASLEDGNPSLWEVVFEHRAAMKDAAVLAKEHLGELQSRTEEFCNAIGLDAPISLREHERLFALAKELMLWKRLPQMWVEASSPNVYFSEISEMSELFLEAKALREQNGEVWRDSFWELDGEAMRTEYREALSKWALASAMGKSSLLKRISAHAKGKPNKDSLGDYLDLLCSYREKRGRAEQLLSGVRDTLDSYYENGSFDWKRISEDARRAKDSILGMREEDDLYAALTAHAGNRRIYAQLDSFAEAYSKQRESMEEYLALIGGEKECLKEALYATLGELCQLGTDAEAEVSLALSWYALAKNVSARDKAEHSAEACMQIADNYLGEEICAILGHAPTPSWLCERLGATQEQAAQFFGAISEYLLCKYEAETLFVRYQAFLTDFDQGNGIDWSEVLRLSDIAEQSARALDDLCGDSAIRRSFAGTRELDAEITEYREALHDLTPVRTSFESLLELEDLSSASEWIRTNRTLCDALRDNIDSVKEWLTWNSVAEEACEAGLGDLVEAYRTTLAHHRVLPAYQKALYRSIAIAEIDRDPALNCFSGALFEERVARFRALDEKLARLTCKEIYCRLASQVPNFAKEASRSSEVGILQKAIKNNGRALSIRNLFEQIPNLLPRLCPCMLMSPLSAAQYLDPKRAPFDLVVFDEASQMPTCKAVGALARGENAVIVGDPKQMPPTSFFAVNAVDEEHIEDEDLESILDDCLALNMPQTHLLWHYRSRHESLISFSNSAFYENKLFTFPSVNDRESKVRMVRVDGVFDRGKTRQNRAEAEAIVEELRRRCYDEDLSRYSVGVVTFNVSQQNLIDDLLTEACAEDTRLEHWVYESKEPLFIKNLENVQGDERDVILFSVGYGPDANGQVFMNFGPLNRDGGWRRLNVAVSRARHEMVVFSSMGADRINLSKTGSEGVAALKAFLEYAQTQRLEGTDKEVSAVSVYTDGILESICERLAEYGYEAVPLVGKSEYRIDVAVIDPKNPERYLLGILLDGVSYQSAKTVRDREVGQISVLEGLGWSVLRVRTMDWWDNSSAEIVRILDELTRLQDKKIGRLPMTESSDSSLNGEELDSAKEEAEADSEDEFSVSYLACNYLACVPSVRNLDAEHLLSGTLDAEIAERICEILSVEAPISEALLTKRILQGYGISRAGTRLSQKLLTTYRSMGLISTEWEGQVFYWNAEIRAEAYLKVRKNGLGENTRDIKDVPKEELINALCLVLSEQFSLFTSDLFSQAAACLGYARVGTQVEARLRTALEIAREMGRITQGQNGAWILPEKKIL